MKRVRSWARSDEISPNFPPGAKSSLLSRVFLCLLVRLLLRHDVAAEPEFGAVQHDAD